MPVTFVGVRHHSPACARLVAETIMRERPAHVLVEGPADMNDRLDELLLPHELPVAVFTSYRDDERAHASWTPFCEYSPEWVALNQGRACGAEVRFIDLPAWHPAFADRQNRYADAEVHYADVMGRLCQAFAVDNVDTLWDHLFEAAAEPADGAGLAERLAAYFDLVRGEAEAGDDDHQREDYMAEWVRAARTDAGARGGVVVVSGGFHRPSLMRLTAHDDVATWPEVPRLPAGAVGGSYVVPYSFKRLDAFDGYQSGMPSPAYYQRLWEEGLEGAGRGLVQDVVTRLRRRRQPASTADLIAARTLALGLARLRSHPSPARTDVLDALVSALVTEPLDVPLPWTGRGRLKAGTDPVVVEMVAALSGERVGRLHPDTPLPPLVHDVEAELERWSLDGTRDVRLDLAVAGDRTRSRVLHRLRVLDIPGVARTSGPATGVDPVAVETWALQAHDLRLVHLIEAGAYGATLAGAAAARIEEGVGGGGGDVGALSSTLLDAVFCGVDELSDRVAGEVGRAVGTANQLGDLGRALAVVLTLWRHDRLLGGARNSLLGVVIVAAVERALWLAEGIRGGPAPADTHRLAAVAAVRDSLIHAAAALAIDREPALAVMRRLSGDPGVPPDLRGAAFGFGWALAQEGDPALAVRGVAGPDVLGDWLTGLFVLAREEVLAAAAADADGEEIGADDLLGVLDDLLARMADLDFLVALPALRQAFEFFPPQEREHIAVRLLERRGLAGSGRSLLRLAEDPALVAAAHELEARVDALLAREGLLP